MHSKLRPRQSVQAIDDNFDCIRLCAGSCLYPYYLHFDGVSSDSAGHSGIGAVLTTPNQQHDFGHVSTYIGSRSSERLAKYKALLAGLDNALKCGIKCLLACGEDEAIVNQVIACQTNHHFTVQFKFLYIPHVKFYCKPRTLAVKCIHGAGEAIQLTTDQINIHSIMNHSTVQWKFMHSHMSTAATLCMKGMDDGKIK